MVMLALVALLPLALANPMEQQGWGNSGWGESNWGKSGWGQNSGWGVQMQGVMQMQGQQQMQQGMQQMQQGNQQWWGMNNKEEYEAYMKWCEERKMAMMEQEAQRELLEELQEKAEEEKREREHEKAQKELKMRRESMMAQWRSWNAQIEMAHEFDDSMEKYEEMKIGYMFELTMDFLKFCKCSDFVGPLQRYLVYGEKHYEHSESEAYNLDDMLSIDTNDVEGTAQMLARLSQAQQTEYYFGGIIKNMCSNVKGYLEQVKQWEKQYNFMGM